MASTPPASIPGSDNFWLPRWVRTIFFVALALTAVGIFAFFARQSLSFLKPTFRAS
jgi:hypothetical protein